jgi:D-lactate dehydrogenase
VYSQLKQSLLQALPAHRVVSDPLRLLAYGTDASLYRLVPRLAVVVESEAEVRLVLDHCRRLGTPVTFRAAGTSLAGQSLTDSVLVLLGDHWNGVTILEGGDAVRLQPGVVGADANLKLLPYGRKIGPDPASINAARIGGIAANNASGMCCGTHENSYQTIRSLRVLLADGSLLDTGSADSRSEFARSHGELLARLGQLAARLKADAPLAERVRAKYRLKNTTGYSLNALVDFEDPIDILTHLLIGSEGTLGFISELTYRTVPELPRKASLLVLFPDMAEACRAIPPLKRTGAVAAAELFDQPAMLSVEQMPGMPDCIKGAPAGSAALLIETRAQDEAALETQMAAILQVLAPMRTLSRPAFATDPKATAPYWNARKGVFPAVAGARPVGTTVIIEDVAFKVEDLASGVLDLQALFERFGYVGCCIYGHALDGNMHFIIYHDFSDPAEVERYRRFLDAVCDMVVRKYDGSLKAEHGTGRNMAPYVELEWGAEAYRLMVELKVLLDPGGLLNPGVVLNPDPAVHLKNFKPMPAADEQVDACMECGFCEPMCPSAGLTFTPRQRITGFREVGRLDAAGADPQATAALRKRYAYDGTRTCAACGLCATVCPMGINTGKLMKRLRGRAKGPVAHKVGAWSARHYGGLLAASGPGLAAVGLVRRLLGDRGFTSLAAAARKLSGGLVPKVTANVPTRVAFRPRPATPRAQGRQVVYLPSCATRSMGPAGNDPVRASVPEVFQRLLEKAGFEVIYPARLDGLCCGQPWETQGLREVADDKSAELERALAAASDGGRLPIVCDTSTCSRRMKEYLDGRLELQDVVEFLHDQVLPRLQLTRQPGEIMLHLNCGARKMGLEPKLVALAQACSEQVVRPEGMTCCGFSGMWGFTTPELNEHATRKLAAQVPEGCRDGYSSNRTCEIGLSDQAGIPYRSIVHLVAKAAGVQ